MIVKEVQIFIDENASIAENQKQYNLLVEKVCAHKK
jgi:hypothetical protein